MQKSSFFKKIQFKFFDVVILIIFISCLAFSILKLKSGGTKKASVIIQTPSEQYIYPLDTNREIKVEGLIGVSVIKIENNTAKFMDSPCPNKTCVACTPIFNNMEWTACLPNQVFVRIDKQDENLETDTSSF